MTTTVKVYHQPQAITTTIADEAYVQLSGSGRGNDQSNNPK